MKQMLIVSVLLALTFTAQGKITSSSQQLNQDVTLISVNAVPENPSIFWAVGTKASLFRSVDSGQTWRSISPPPDAVELQFRDVLPVSDKQVFIMSVGTEGKSRIYLTEDGGENWKLDHQAQHKQAFFNCMDRDAKGDIWLYGDKIDQHVFLRKRSSGKWHKPNGIPVAVEKEGGFAASGTCLQHYQGKIYVGTGAGERPRLLILRGETNQVIDTPFVPGSQAGIFSLQVNQLGVWTFGGDLQNKPATSNRAFRYHHGQWSVVGEPPMAGNIYGSSVAVDNETSLLLLANPQGLAASEDKGKTWQLLSEDDHWAVHCTSTRYCVAVGAKGRVTVIKNSH